jgi:cytochrome oxidase Cu insertion factor (SCO1/SenC/PrrC family)
MKRITKVLIFIFSVIAIHVYGQNNQPMIGEQAPDFTLTDFSGEKITLSKFQGNFVIIHFAASW